MGTNVQKMIEYSSLSLECALAVQSILNLHILEMPGEHGRGVFRVRLEPGQEAAMGMDEAVTLWVRGGQGRQGTPLFSGCLDGLLVREEGGDREAELTVLSGTVRLDRKKRDRAFQDVSMGYGRLVGRILDDNGGSACILAVDDREIGTPFFQYRETDWGFLKRAASRLGEPLVADCRLPRPRFYLGMREGAVRELPGAGNIRQVMEGERYYRLRGKGMGVARRDFLCYDITTAVDMDLGERVRMDGRLLSVSRREAGLEDGRVLFTYRLAGKGYSRVAPCDNGELTGLELPARVTGTSGEMCELALDIDPGQEGGHGYPYAPMTGNLMYCMPQEQTRAYLRLGSSSEGSGMVSRCIRTNGDACEGLSSPEQRSFHTEHGKGLEFNPGTLGFTGEGTGSLTLCDEEGISFGSTGGITLHAQGNILVESSKSIHLDALTQVVGQSLLETFSAFCVNDRFDYLSSRTMLEGRETRRYRPFDDAPAEGKFDWAGFARNLLYGVMVTTALIVASVLTGGIAAAAFLGAGIAAGMTTVVISATDYSTGNVRSYEEAKHAIDVAAICGAVTGAVSCLLSGLSIFANPFADMVMKEVIEGCVDARMGILIRTFESMGMPPEERLAYIYDWKAIILDFGVGTLIGIGVGSAGIAFKSAAGEAVEQAVREGAGEVLENAAERAAKESAEEALENAAERAAKESAGEALENAAERAAKESAGEALENAAERAAKETVKEVDAEDLMSSTKRLEDTDFPKEQDRFNGGSNGNLKEQYPHWYDAHGNYTGGRTQEALDALAFDPHKGKITNGSITEREVILALEEQGYLEHAIRDTCGR